MQVVHGDERRDDCNGKRDDGNQCGTKVEEENDNDEADDDCFLDQIALQCLNGFLNQAGTIICANDFYSGRQRTFDLL